MYEFMLPEYRSSPQPFSIAALESALDLRRDRVCAALVYLIFVRQDVRTVGQQVRGTGFYPVDEG